MITTVHIVCILLAVALVALALLFRIRNQRLRARLDSSEHALGSTIAALEHLRHQQARKIDRALWMLCQVRSDRAITKAPQLIREPLQVTIGLHVDLVDALERNEPDAHEAIVGAIAQHVARRVAKTATTT